MGIDEMFEAMVKDPKLMEKLSRRADLDNFREKYKVKRATPLRCPACSQYGMSGGALWGPEEGTENKYVCHKCLLEWIVSCETVSTEELMLQIRQANKGESNFPTGFKEGYKGVTDEIPNIP